MNTTTTYVLQVMQRSTWRDADPPVRDRDDGIAALRLARAAFHEASWRLIKRVSTDEEVTP